MELENIKSKIEHFTFLLKTEGENVRQALIDKNYKQLEIELHKEKSTAKALRKFIRFDKVNNV